MADIFMSYAREDRNRVSKLAETLGLQRGWSVWFDARLRAGERFTREIEAALASSRCVLVVWSRYSLDSDWVRAEATEGWERGILVPVLFEECEPPLPFRQTETANLSNWHGSGAPELLRLMDDIERILARGAAATSEELLQREKRRRTLRRRRTIRKVTFVCAGIIAFMLCGLAYYGYSKHQARLQLAERLAGQADMMREEVIKLKPGEENKYWWWIFVNEKDRFDRFESSVLLAIEATRVARTEHTVRSLRNGLVLLPWSDWNFTIENLTYIRAMDFNYDEKLLAATVGERDTLVWDFEANEVRARILHGSMGSRMSRYVLDFSPSENILATAGPDATARLWDPFIGQELHRLAHDGIVNAVSFAPNGQQLVTASEDGSVRLWDVRSGRELSRMQHGEAAVWAGFSPLGDRIASIGGTTARIWAVSSGKELTHLEHTGGAPEAANFSPNGALLATFGEQIETSIWELPSGRLIWRLPLKCNGNAGAVFSTDGGVLVTGDIEGTLSWWSLENREAELSISQGGYILAMAQSADHRRLVTIAAREARVMDFETGRLLKLKPYARGLSAVSLTPDGRLLASSGEVDWGTTAITITRVWPDDPVRYACSKLSRNLTRNEWQKYFGDAPFHLTCPEIAARQP